MACHFSPDVVRMLARGTLGAIVDHIGMKDELRDAVYAAVGGGHDTDPRDFAAIEDGDAAREAARVQQPPQPRRPHHVPAAVQHEVRRLGSHAEQRGELGR